ncbi:hypothetical protein FXW07_07995 [Methanosarcina sp. DH1]|uniref:BREX system ATP-binding domain-containing protein n=1 Tax=Methanosarcina sp. DH1 TaxID=2605695 RepID=UPI001E53BFEB|nr:BREX system ATP-binding domain-containing protein [Methanosarcina sp. DH1]MCC4766559.1 hypothetical protein [Methanosarcina sp. DH1]
MDWKPQKGDSVKTKFGIGIIVKVYLDKFLVCLIEKNLEGYMGIDEISPLNVTKTPAIKNPANHKLSLNDRLAARPKIPTFFTTKIQKSDEIKENIHQSKVCIDALRFGLVPDNYLEDLTIKYEETKKWVRSSFPKSTKENNQIIKRPVTNQIVGQFGDGKSHLMSTIRHIAMEEGYLIARTEVDGNKVSFSNPNTLLYSLWRNLEGKELSKSTPLLDLFCKAIHNGYEIPKISCLSTDRIRKLYYLIKKMDAQGDLENVKFMINDFLSCNERINATEAKKVLKAETKLKTWDITNEVFPLISQRVNERTYTFIECIVGIALLSRYAGYEGLILLIDELEVESVLLSTSKQRERFIENLEMLSTYVTGKTEYPETSLGIYFASVGDEWDIGSKYIAYMVKGSGQEPYHIQPIVDWNLSNKEILEFVSNVYHIYREAYTLMEDPDFGILSELEEILQNEQMYESGAIRYFVKKYVGLLDKRYGPP